MSDGALAVQTAMREVFCWTIHQVSHRWNFINIRWNIIITVPVAVVFNFTSSVSAWRDSSMSVSRDSKICGKGRMLLVSVHLVEHQAFKFTFVYCKYEFVYILHFNIITNISLKLIIQAK